MATITTVLTDSGLTALADEIDSFSLASASDTQIVLNLVYSDEPLAEQLILTGTGLSFVDGVLASG